MHPHTLRRLGAASLLTFVAACNSDQPVAPESAQISDAPVAAVATVSAALTGTTVLLAVPDTVQLTVRNSVIKRSKIISWRTTNSAVAIVTTSGRVIAKGPGDAQIVASGGGRSETTFLTVVSTGVQLTATPTSIALTAGGRAQIAPVSKTATGALLRYRQYTYQSYNAAVASVDVDGLVTGMASGATQIEVYDGSVSSTVPVSVNGGSADAASVVGFALNPASTTLSKGATRQFATLAVWSDGVSRPVAVTYSATGGNISVGGLFTAGQVVGAFTVIATCSCGLADTSLVSVSSVATPVATLSSLTMTPPAVSLAPSGTQDFVVTALWSDGGTNLPALTFTTNGGSVTAQGRYTAPASAGNYRVIVNGGGKADTSLVTVTSAASSLTSLSLTPASVTLLPSATLQFTTSALWSNGSTALPTRVYSANGGTVTSTGLYTASATPGTYRVVVTSGIQADTSVVTVSTTVQTPTLSSLQISPATVTLQPGASQQFSASALWSNGGTTLPAVIYSATGGTVSSTGAYTAPTTAGTYKVVLQQASGTLADTSTVSVTAVTPPTGNGLAASDDYSTYANTAALQARMGVGSAFFYYDNINPHLASIDNTVLYNGGNTMKYTFHGGREETPQLVVRVNNLRNMWFRVKVRFSPGFTTTGEYNGVVTAANPTGYRSANAYKFLSWGWGGLNGRGEIAFTNTNELLSLVGVFPPDYPTRTAMNTSSSTGRVTTEWTDGRWYEYIIHYEILSPTTSRQRVWVTADGGTPVLRTTTNLSGYADVTLPSITRIQLGRNFNQLRLPSQTMYLWYARFDVYDGSVNANPFGV